MNAKVQLLLWMAHPALELSLAAVMVWRKLHRSFPVFFYYILSEVAIFGILFPIHQYGDYDYYFYGYWIGAAVSLALGFMVIHEVFLDVFRPYHTLKDLGNVLFKWAALVMVFVAIVVSAASPADQSPLVQAVVMVQRCVRLIQCGLILFLLVFSRYLGVSWRQHSFGIVLGFGGYASVELAGNALYSGGQIQTPINGFMDAVAYCLAVATWLGYAILKAPAREASLSLMASQRWETSLNDLHRPVGGDSLIPMFEGMVDRAFSRSVRAGEPEPETVQSQSIRKPAASSKLQPSLSGPRVQSQR
jgi:hypothetical protein